MAFRCKKEPRMMSFSGLDPTLTRRLLQIIYRPDQIFEFQGDLSRTRDSRLWIIGGGCSAAQRTAGMVQGIGHQFLAFHPP
jgi:hypothetical protein